MEKEFKGLKVTPGVHQLLTALEGIDKYVCSVFRSDQKMFPGAAVTRSGTNRPTIWVLACVTPRFEQDRYGTNHGQRIELGSDGVWRFPMGSSSPTTMSDLNGYFREGKTVVAKNFDELIKHMKQVSANPNYIQIKELEDKLATEKSRHNNELTKIEEQLKALKQ